METMVKMWVRVVSVWIVMSAALSAGVVVKDARDVPRGGIELQTGKQTFVLKYTSPIAVDGKRAWTEPFFGLGLSDSTNWYGKGAGFISLELNGRLALLDSAATITVFPQGGKKGVVRLAWKHPSADVLLTAVALENDDKLMCEMRFAPKEPLKRIRLMLVNYPMGFALGQPVGSRDRWIATAKQELQQPAKAVLSPDEPWIFYFDKKITESGPSAILLNQDDKCDVTVEVNEYPVYTYVTVPPESGRVRFALWEYPRGTTWPDGLKEFQAGLEKARRDLKQETFEPAAKIEIKQKN